MTNISNNIASSTPMVSVHMISYNHEKFIEKAIEGVLMQQTNFKFELVISDDCSTDNTLEKILLYANKHPQIIKLISRKFNIGSINNYSDTFTHCIGKYIAICDGDDFWTDHHKLQKQVDFLENNPNYIIHSGNATYLSSTNKNEKLIYNTPTDSVFSLDDFLHKNHLITCTVMFRNIKLNLSAFANKLMYGDWFLYVILLNQTTKKAYRTTEIYSTYRVHSGGISQSINKKESYNKHIYQIISIHKYLKTSISNDNVITTINNYSFEKYKLELSSRSYRKAIGTIFSNICYCKFKSPIKKYAQQLKRTFFQANSI